VRIKNEQERSFYEIEAVNQQWTVRQLQRQYGSSLYERLALSRDKTEVMRLANEGQVVENPRDLLKNPLVLEFLGLEENLAFKIVRLFRKFRVFRVKKVNDSLRCSTNNSPLTTRYW